MPKKKQKPQKEIKVRKPFDFGKLVLILVILFTLFVIGVIVGIINVAMMFLILLLWIIKTPINLLITAIVIVIIWVVIRGMKR